MAQVFVDGGVQLLVLCLCQGQSGKGYALNKPALKTHVSVVGMCF